MIKFFVSLFCFFLLCSYGCTQQPNISKEIKVDNCSYVDEYFDYCKSEYIDEYKNILKNDSVNFNKKFILKAVIHTKHDYSGVVAIDKSTGIVSTMLFGFKINGKSNQISSNINSDIFCIKGEVNSKSLGVTKNGDNCFKYNKNGFELIDKNKDKIKNEDKLFPIKYKNNKFKCGSNNCNFVILNKENYNKISQESESSELRLMTNERGFDTSYIDASDNNNILYIVRYSEGDEQEEILYLAYFLNGEFKTKLLGGGKSLEIFNSRNISFNGHKIILN